MDSLFARTRAAQGSSTGRRYPNYSRIIAWGANGLPSYDSSPILTMPPIPSGQTVPFSKAAACRLIDQSVADGESHQLVDTVEIEFLHNPAAMGVHGIDAEIQHDGDLFV